MASLTEDHKVYFQYVYELGIAAGYTPTEANTLSEMAVYKRRFEGIQYSKTHETQLENILRCTWKHHQSPHNKEK